MSSSGRNGEQAIADESLSDRIDALSTQLQRLRDDHRDLQGEIETVRAERDDLRDRVDELENAVANLDSRTNLLELVEQPDDLGPTQRATVLIQHLRRKAISRRDRGETAAAEIDRDGAEEALRFPDLDRTTIYKDMRRAERLIGDEAVLEYDGDEWGNARLRLDLETGELPTQFAEVEKL